MTSITLKMTPAQLKTMQKHYTDFLLAPVPHSLFRAKRHGVTITAYNSGKVLFQGNDADKEASLWQPEATTSNSTNGNLPNLSTASKQASSSLPQGFRHWSIIGSDEVGNGSYFGPLTVCSVFLEPKDFELIEFLGVKDSKLLSDNQIREIASELKHAVTHELTICSPLRYNQAIAKGYNAVSIKVSLHNFTIGKLRTKLSPDQQQQLQGVLIDQFTPQASYLNYLKKEANPYTKDLYFVKKGEGEHLAVAAASILARAAFLDSLEELGKPYGGKLPSGAGTNVDVYAAKLIRKYGADVLNNVAKLHFKNTDKAKKLIKK